MAVCVLMQVEYPSCMTHCFSTGEKQLLPLRLMIAVLVTLSRMKKSVIIFHLDTFANAYTVITLLSVSLLSLGCHDSRHEVVT